MSRCWIPLLFIALLYTGTSLANKPPWFEVEIIIFTRDLDQVSQSEEWPRSPGTPDFTNARPLQPGTGQTPGPYALIPKKEYRLMSAFRRLQRTGSKLRPVVHLAWRQPVTSREQSELLYVRALEKMPTTNITGIIESQPPAPPKLEGTILVTVNRYLHVYLDLIRYAKKPPTYAIDDEFPVHDFIVKTPAFTTYRMQSHRRMRSGELHYLDHPLMGALIKITPYKLPKVIPEPIPETIVNPVTPTTGSVQSTQPPAINP
ncbi:hypothetical protein MNBD_GAMMA26-2001 [hydrothermal vent metagenome]|uniref:Peptidoglycan-binding protein CsiV n=1 Tax=hydrothermal vent metagenome TaxID=652676 RepID=A0A3B1AM38_9ZZZZ